MAQQYTKLIGCRETYFQVFYSYSYLRCWCFGVLVFWCFCGVFFWGGSNHLNSPVLFINWKIGSFSSSFVGFTDFQIPMKSMPHLIKCMFLSTQICPQFPKVNITMGAHQDLRTPGLNSWSNDHSRFLLQDSVELILLTSQKVMKSDKVLLKLIERVWATSLHKLSQLL